MNVVEGGLQCSGAPHVGWCRAPRCSARPPTPLSARRFALNDQQSFNVKGVGINEFGRFAVCGTFLPLGANTGMMELFKWYTEYSQPLAAPAGQAKKAAAPRKVSGGGVGGGGVKEECSTQSL